MQQSKEPQASRELIVPKLQKQVNLWVHPEGLVVGSLFLRRQSANRVGAEEPLEVLDNPSSFLVLRLDDPEEFRFYNRASIIRVEYTAKETPPKQHATKLACQLYMMDGSVIDGAFKESLPPDHSRLLDYLNKDNRFVKVYLDVSNICLVNKSYIIRVSTMLSSD